MKTYADKIIQPLLSEKSSSRETRFNEFALVVEPSMTKTQIKEAVEKLFGVKPLAVRTVNFRKKQRRTNQGGVSPKSFKKALVRLPEGKRIELK